MLSWLKQLKRSLSLGGFGAQNSMQKMSSRRRRKQEWSARNIEAVEARMLLTGTWALATLEPAGHADNSLLLPNGNVLVHSAPLGGATNSAAWYELTPDSTGGYQNGTWSTVATMNVGRNLFGSAVLPNGNIFVVGGQSSSSGANTNTAEIYVPSTNTWSVAANSPKSNVGNVPIEVLPGGNVMVGNFADAGTEIYNPSTNTWSTGATKVHADDKSVGESWVKLSNGDILTYDLYSSINASHGVAELYNPTTNTWSDVSTGLSSLPLLTTVALGEQLGPAVLLPNGNALFTGANGTTAEFNPATNTWSAGPTMPTVSGAQLTTAQAAAAVLPNGSVLMSMSPEVASPGALVPPTYLYELDPSTNTFTNVTPSSSMDPLLSSINSYQTSMLVLPTSQVLFNGSSNSSLIYTPSGTPNSAWRPQITGITSSGGGSYTITGTQLNGLNEGTAQGSGNQMASNYPIVQVTDLITHVVSYATTSNWSSVGVATGSTPETVHVQMPSSLGTDPFTLIVIANGITSATLTPPPLPVGQSASAMAVSASGTFYELSTTGNLYSWSLPATSWTLQQNAVSSIKFSPGGVLYTLQVNGNLDFLSGSTWTPTIFNVNSFGFTPSGTEYALLSNGVLFNATAGVVTLTDVSSFQISPSGVIYALQTGGNLDFLPGGSWITTISNVRSFGFTPSGAEYALLPNGSLFNATSGTVVLTNISQFAVAPNGDTYALQQGGTLSHLTSSGWVALSPGIVVHSFKLGAGGTLFGMLVMGNLSRWNGSAWVSLAVNVSTYQITGSGALYNLQTTGDLQEYNFATGGWTTISSSIQSFQVSPDGLVFALSYTGNITSWDGSAWSATLRSNAASMAVAPNGTLYDLQISGNTLERFNPGSGGGSSWTTIATGVSSFEIAPDSTVYMLTTAGSLNSWNGTTLTAISPGVLFFEVTANGTVYAQMTGTSNGLFMLNPATMTWTAIASNVMSFAQAPDSTIYVLLSTGTLDYWNGTALSVVTTGVTGYILRPNGELYVNGSYYSG